MLCLSTCVLCLFLLLELPKKTIVLYEKTLSISLLEIQIRTCSSSCSRKPSKLRGQHDNFQKCRLSQYGRFITDPRVHSLARAGKKAYPMRFFC
jgi:hypothetical protein